MLVGGRAGFGRNRRCAASPRHAGRSGIQGAGGALRRGAIFEIILLCGFYRTVSYIANGLDLPLEAKAARFPAAVN
jgi:hypothetical protein